MTKQINVDGGFGCFSFIMLFIVFIHSCSNAEKLNRVERQLDRIEKKVCNGN